MPSTSAKQHRFMQAVAHSPSFAKKAGVSQSVGKDFSAADKGKTFNKGGMMKKGKRFNGEDGESGVEYHDYDPDKTYSGRFTDDETGGLAENTPTRSTAKAAPAAPAAAKPPVKKAVGALTDRESDGQKYSPPKSSFGETKGRQAWSPSNPDTSRQAYDSDEVGAVTGRRGDPKYKRVVTDEQKAKNAENFAEVTAALIPMGGATATVARKLGQTGIKAAQEARMSKAVADYAKGRTKEAQEAFKAANRNDRNVVAMERNSMFGSKDAARKYAESGGMKRGGGISRFAMGGDMPAPGGARPDPRMMAAMRAKQAARQQPMRRPPPGGMPPPAQPPMGMKKGGAAKFAKGGGIESRGKTKGTVIRMAAGGSVSSRADGIAQRGKTKFTNY